MTRTEDRLHQARIGERAEEQYGKDEHCGGRRNGGHALGHEGEHFEAEATGQATDNGHQHECCQRGHPVTEDQHQQQADNEQAHQRKHRRATP